MSAPPGARKRPLTLSQLRELDPSPPNAKRRPGAPPDDTLDDAYQEALFAGKGCHCKHSRCLKLYCDCFAGGRLCTSSCQCVSCANDELDSHLFARKALEKRKPKAFQQKFELAAGEGAELETHHTRGCRCSKSRCLKRYCECFRIGVRCGEKCACVDCANHTSNSEPLLKALISTEDLLADHQLGDALLGSLLPLPPPVHLEALGPPVPMPPPHESGRGAQ